MFVFGNQIESFRTMVAGLPSSCLFTSPFVLFQASPNREIIRRPGFSPGSGSDFLLLVIAQPAFARAGAEVLVLGQRESGFPSISR